MAIFLIVCLVLSVVTAQDRVFTFQNNLPFTVWVGSLGNAGQPQIADGGWQLDSGSTVTQNVPAGWAGRFWGRTQCDFSADGSSGSCVTGDCGRGLRCNGAGGAPPATLAEFTLNGNDGLDFYDISLVDGFNLPLSIQPTDQTGSGRSCTTAGCTAAINDVCPDNLRVNDGCRSSCVATQAASDCCEGQFNGPNVCQPSQSATIFKSNCPDAYSYADTTSTFTCQNTNYLITFGF